MNKFIKAELAKVNNTVKLPYYDDNTLELVIPKREEEQKIGLEVNNYYLIELADYILNPPPNFTLASNWNRGVNPTSKFLKIFVNQIMGKMVRVDGCGFDISAQKDLSDIYSGLWLPEASIVIHQKLS